MYISPLQYYHGTVYVSLYLRNLVRRDIFPDASWDSYLGSSCTGTGTIRALAVCSMDRNGPCMSRARGGRGSIILWRGKEEPSIWYIYKYVILYMYYISSHLQSRYLVLEPLYLHLLVVPVIRSVSRYSYQVPLLSSEYHSARL